MPALVSSAAHAQLQAQTRRWLRAGDSAHGNRAEVRVVALYHLNEIQGGMLLSGAADGSVRVWRNFSHRGAQRLASAWRVSRLHTTYVPCPDPLLRPST